jgi:16S rRNA (uracil1498-N3)-methyltransferase
MLGKPVREYEMTASPALLASSSPPENCPRLFVDIELSDGLDVRIDGGQAHYLISVMRLKHGAPVKLFDDRTGEWLAEVSMLAKRDLILTVCAKLRAREDVPDLWLLAAPIKKARIDMVAEKACELGVALYQPVITRRTIIERLKTDRLRAHMIEAAEQCGRTALPIMEKVVKLPALLTGWPSERVLFFADEEGGVPFAEAVRMNPGPAAILIGPEGGFDAEERNTIRSVPQAVGISLGTRILRAETAALAAISVWMSTGGDWQ